MDSSYGRPLTDYQETPNSIVTNQQSPAVMVHPGMFKTQNINLNCTFCHKFMRTNVTKSISLRALLLCLFSFVIFYILFQYCRGKEIWCYNATHTCPYCGQIVGTYDAC